jgi:nucleoside-diphosphate-sugar epimerase
MPKLLACGYGYAAARLSARLAAQGWRIAATARSAGKADALTAAGVEGHVVREGEALPKAAWAGATHVLLSAPPGERGDPFLAALSGAEAGGLRWIGYLSTTGVYGDHGGAWVTEESALRAVSPRGRRRVEAERAWAAWGAERGVTVQIFRLAGIYGPGRSQFDALREGTARRIVKPGQIFSRIHVDDIAGVLERGIANPSVHGAFNVCDDEPAAPAEVMEYAARLIGLPPPPLEDFETARATMSEMALSFYADNKRVSNAKMKAVLGVRLNYPSFKEGLSAIWAEDNRMETETNRSKK